MLAAQQAAVSGIQSTAGAVPVRNEKGICSGSISCFLLVRYRICFPISGELSMQKVKVQRYISGKRPEYAQYVSSDDESEEEDFSDRKTQTQKSYSRAEEISLEIARLEHSAQIHDQHHIDDPRLKRLQQVQRSEYDDDEERLQRHRHIHEPEIVESEEESEPEETTETVQTMRNRRIALGSDSETDTELSDTEIEQKRQRMRQKMMQQRKEEEVLMKEEEKSESSESESSEYEEESESEEDNEPRMKPLFVRKRDRATIAEKEKEAAKQRQVEYEAKKVAKERRRQTLKLVEDSVKKDLEKAKPESSEPNIDDVCTEDENDEVEYEAWKLRELKRIKRDREEKEQYVATIGLVVCRLPNFQFLISEWSESEWKWIVCAI